ncbi:MAG TPA: polysaccharide deacetylase family protein [Verrucomicrobiae bacterium]|nr:polysaccharide deacetylase family protein [Verrucomicrobiae bacterium]
MRPAPLLLLLLLVSLLLPNACFAAHISELSPVFRPCLDAGGARRIAIRSFTADGVASFLVVDPFTFGTAVETEKNLRFLQDLPADSPYLQALARYNHPSERIQNEGVRRAEGVGRGVFLTVDMCPSAREMEHEVFRRLAERGMSGGVPVAVAVTGAWLDRHPAEMRSLLRLQAEGKLAITWVNHSDSHPYRPGVALERNFLLSDGIDFRREVLETERKLLESGGLPSPFFRYPGLVSSVRLAEQLRSLSLIPLGAEAWLAKGEKPRDGSIILIHGNGNEPPGVARFLDLLAREDLKFLPLPALFRR